MTGIGLSGHCRNGVPLAATLVLFLLAGCSLVATGEGDDRASAPPEVAATSGPDQSTAPPSDVESPPEPTSTAVVPSTESELELDGNGVAPGEFPALSVLGQLGASGTCEHLGDEWCVDSNGNVWPDFVEEELGRDPSINDCLRTDCGGPDLVDFDLAAFQENTLFILDASGSMGGDAGGGRTKMDAAKSALVEYVTITPEYVDLGLMVYGHQGDNSDAGRPVSCAGIDTFAAIGDLTFENVEGVIGQFQATGWTPIAASLDAAGPVVQSAAQEDASEGLEGVTNRIILISDGIETCDGDPVASAQALLDLGIEVVVDVIGFDIPDSDRAALQQVAEVTGGVYSDAADGAALRNVLGEYDAQQVAVSVAITCQVEAISQSGNCGSDLNMSASDYVLDLADEAEANGDGARHDFIVEWASFARIEALDARVAVQDDLRVQLEVLRDLYDEAVVRREEFNAGRNDKPIGRTVSVVCPFADSA